MTHGKLGVKWKGQTGIHPVSCTTEKLWENTTTWHCRPPDTTCDGGDKVDKFWKKQNFPKKIEVGYTMTYVIYVLVIFRIS